MGRIHGDLLDRAFSFAGKILSIVDQLPSNNKGWELGRQIIRSGTSIGANVREADHAISRADFANKCSIARKESSEVGYWLDLCKSSGLMKGPRVDELIKESIELLCILGAVVKSSQEPRKR